MSGNGAAAALAVADRLRRQCAEKRGMESPRREPGRGSGTGRGRAASSGGAGVRGWGGGGRARSLAAPDPQCGVAAARAATPVL